MTILTIASFTSYILFFASSITYIFKLPFRYRIRNTKIFSIIVIFIIIYTIIFYSIFFESLNTTIPKSAKIYEDIKTKRISKLIDVSTNRLTDNFIVLINNTGKKLFNINKDIVGENYCISIADFILFNMSNFFGKDYLKFHSQNDIIQWLCLIEHLIFLILTILYIPIIFEYISLKQNIEERFVFNNSIIRLHLGEKVLKFKYLHNETKNIDDKEKVVLKINGQEYKYDLIKK